MCDRPRSCEENPSSLRQSLPLFAKILAPPFLPELCWPLWKSRPQSQTAEREIHVYRLALRVALLAAAIPVFLCAVSHAQTGSDIVRYFSGKQVLVKIDMPGTQKGIDLRFNKDDPMNWKEYSSRLKQCGTAIRKGDIARVTGVVVKKDMIEFQLDGGGFGTFGDDANTTVVAKTVPKSDYEKSLEQQIANTDDPDKRRQLQRDLDRERARRERQTPSTKAPLR